MVRANNITMANRLRFSGTGVVEYVATRLHSSGTFALLFGGHAARVLVLAV